MDFDKKFKEVSARISDTARISGADGISQVPKRREAWIRADKEIKCELPKRFGPLPQAQHIIRKMGVPIDWDIDFQPAYSPQIDRIKMPKPKYFHDQAGYYSTVFHELAHSTGHRRRLNRKTINNYQDHIEMETIEEITAELAAAYITSTLGLDDMERQAGYIFHWALNGSHNPLNAMMLGMKQASEAAKFILNKGM